MAEKEYIERGSLLQRIALHANRTSVGEISEPHMTWREVVAEIQCSPAADVVELRHGHWMLEAHNERVNCRWNVTAECSECCNGQKEIWAGFFPGVPEYLAESVALQDAEQVELDNYCQHCGAKMDGGKHETDR